MATEAAAPSPAPSAQLVGNAFVEQYYLILHSQPELVHRFYQDSSVLSRPGPNGDMTAVSTQTAINEKIMSLNYSNHKTEIKTVDAQESHQEGVVVLVTGCLIGNDDVKRKFTQTFFLAPQDKGYFVLNDVFRYIDENDHVESKSVSVNGAPESIQSTPVTPDPELTHVPDLPVVEQTTTAAEVVLSNGDAIHEPSDSDVSVVEEAVGAPVFSNDVQVQTVSEPTSTVQEDTPKKSYASIVKVMKGNKTPASVYVPANAEKIASATATKVAAAVTEQKPVGTATTAPEASAPSNNNASESDNPEEAEGHSIYIRSLPLTVTVAQVEEEFKKFGDIKPNGVQVRSNRGFCFGFVEFESISSMEQALLASPVTIGGRQAHVEEKRTTTRVTGSGRPSRFPQGRGGGFRNENFRGRGNFGGGRGYGRNEFGIRTDFSGRRGSGGRSGDGYQRVDNGNGRVGRQGVMDQATVAV